jgi:hypothetical protein
MHIAIGIYVSPRDAQVACNRLHAELPGTKVRVLAPHSSARELAAALPTEDAEQPGMGATVGGVVGGAVGAAAASLVVPPVGAVAVIGLAAGALLGVGGGAMAGGALEDALSIGLPKDELFLYEDALRQGRVVVAVFAPHVEAADAARALLVETGAETVDAARERWWTGLRDAEAEHYDASGHDFEADEALFRQGFEAAQIAEQEHVEERDLLSYLATRHPDAHHTDPFRRGWVRGREHAARVRAGLEDPLDDPMQSHG